MSKWWKASFAYSAELWPILVLYGHMFMSLQGPCVKILTLSVMVLESGAIGWLLGHEKAFVDEMYVLMRGIPER